MPMLGNALSMVGDVQGFLVRAYQRHGGIFRIRALHQSFTVLAGAEANHLLRDRGDELFSSATTMGGLDREFDMRVHVLRGRPHRHLRKLLATGISRDLLAARWETVTAETERMLADWRTGPASPWSTSSSGWRRPSSPSRSPVLVRSSGSTPSGTPSN
ncbi:hypothetical protein O7626_12070 [Micromonospora sp. WMMD1102]|uniref:hypothetical protein n=1 Tax=Micromonospora sp. WMMD1102 TaxID=3016105 RepID=UPI002415240F|nr:hypothetical protein [Micromonospora sp. WMMD1102]MDG4786659.1 hypothetical protein [Micromonospora sp. WMMD1102]